MLSVQQRRGGQQPRLMQVPGEAHGFVKNPGRSGIRAGPGQRLGEAQQQLAPFGWR